MEQRIDEPDMLPAVWIGGQLQWKQYGSIVQMHNGGFDVRHCPNPERLAAYIVRACNNHRRLVRQLHKAKNFMDGFAGDSLQDGIDALLSEMDAALAEAEV